MEKKLEEISQDEIDRQIALGKARHVQSGILTEGWEHYTGLFCSVILPGRRLYGKTLDEALKGLNSEESTNYTLSPVLKSVKEFRYGRQGCSDKLLEDYRTRIILFYRVDV